MRKNLTWGLFIALIALVTVWGNLRTEPGPVVPKKSFLDDAHPTNTGTAYADSIGFNEVLGAMLLFKDEHGNTTTLELEHVPTIFEFHRRFEDFVKRGEEDNIFKGTVLSIANYSRLDTEGGIGSLPYLEEGMTPRDLTTFRRYAWANPGVNTRLVDKGFSFASFLFFPESIEDESAMARRFSEEVIQNGKKLGSMQTDLHPEDFGNAKVYATGWSVARYWLTRMLYIDNLKLVTLGFLLLMGFFWLYTRSFWHTLLLLGVYPVVLSLVRGSIGFLDATGIFPTEERVFTTLPFALTLVVVVSIASHTWSAYKKALLSGEDIVLGIRAGVGRVLFLAIFVAFVSFAISVFTTDLQVLKEISILFSLSLLYSWFITMEVVPRMLKMRLFSGYTARLLVKGKVERIFDSVSDFAANVSVIMRPVWVLFIMLVMLSISATLIYTGAFKLGGGSERYLKGTHFEESMNLLNANLMPGFTMLDFTFTCESSVYGETSHRNPSCIEDIQRVSNEVSQNPLVRGVEGLPPGEMQYLADSLLGKKYPETLEDVERLFEGLESTGNQYFEIEEQMLFDDGYRILVSTTFSEGETLRGIRDEVVEIASRVKGLTARYSGSDATWADVDIAVVRDSIQNVLLDILILFLLVFVYFHFFAGEVVRKSFNPIKAGLVVIVPFVFTTCVMIIMMSILGIPLNTSTASINQMVVAAAADFLFFLLFAYILLMRDYETLPHKIHTHLAFKDAGTAVTGDAVFNVIAFSLLLLSSFSPIRMLGLLLIVAVASTWFAAMFLVLPGMKWALRSK